jgi:hypothetical protein
MKKSAMTTALAIALSAQARFVRGPPVHMTRAPLGILAGPFVSYDERRLS